MLRAIPSTGRKTGSHFSRDQVLPAQSRTENRLPLFPGSGSSCAIPDGKPVPTFPGIRFFLRNPGRKTGSHFSWDCF
ncbi:MAG: hypothetical protein CMJ42_12850 [Phyllobacteriaceae bacterium]|nr:hypothetical protein [Phyllobacteriaceae bacterium]MBA91821.1 hypothetical protein [Phyllobacteriaceae bacterium]